MSRIAVVSAVDGGNLAQTAVVAASIAAHAGLASQVDYHILYGGPDSELTEIISGLRHGSVTMRLHRVKNELGGDGWREHVSAATLLRFRIPGVLSELTRVLYLDADVVVLCSLDSLFRTNLKGAVAAGAVDMGLQHALWGENLNGSTEAISRFQQWPGFSEADLRGYVNAGVLLLDLDGLRRMDFEARAVEMMRSMGPQLLLRDQDVINFLLRGRIRRIDPTWNTIATVLRPEVRFADQKAASIVRSQGRRPRILHFASAPKPWTTSALPPLSGIWWFYARRSATARYFRQAFAQHGLAEPGIEGFHRLWRLVPWARLSMSRWRTAEESGRSTHPTQVEATAQ